jgi:hypothetical protein
VRKGRRERSITASSARRRFLIMRQGFVGTIKRGLAGKRFVMNVRGECDVCEYGSAINQYSRSDARRFFEIMRRSVVQ